MGLTIHYQLIAPAGTDAARAREIVMQLRRRAQDFKHRGRVDRVHPPGDDPESLRWAREWMWRPDPSRPSREFQAEIPPLAGFIFPVSMGKDCEPLWLGLCRYPLTVRLGGQRVRTRLNGWRLHGFCKTQYASLHGWAHLRRCHTAVIDLLAGARRLGLAVEINDEGDYWPGHDLAALRRNLDEMNGAIAAAAGVMKDWNEETGGAPVKAPILAHPHFERLEAVGEARGYASRLRKALR